MSSKDADQYGRWTTTNSCRCGTSRYYSFRMTREQCPLTNAVARGTWNLFRGIAAVVTLGASTAVNGGLASAHHHYVEVCYKCDRCGHTFRRTYELRGNGSKQRRTGCYKNVDKVHKSTNHRASYDKIETIFDKMWSGYSAVHYNCYTWSLDFYSKVVVA